MKKRKEFRVIPNLSLKGKDVLNRLNNRSLILEPGGQYNLDEKIEEARRMSKLDILNQHRLETANIANFRKKLQNG